MLYVIAVMILIFDQITKYLAVKHLKGKAVITIIDNMLEFSYVENYGAAFGILQNRKYFFIFMTSLVIVAIFVILVNNYNYLNKPMKVALAMLVGGSLGNLIDRIRLGYVIDFISVKFGNSYNFPVFNIADSFIVIATILIVYMVIFNKYEVRRTI
ncbi:MAG TPA: signal peptidase II [Tissierellales bacterium]|nr:signal peptidase II [Tissierellales bacterium]